jgi:hypothetical protein
VFTSFDDERDEVVLSHNGVRVSLEETRFGWSAKAL